MVIYWGMVNVGRAALELIKEEYGSGARQEVVLGKLKPVTDEEKAVDKAAQIFIKNLVVEKN